MNRLKTIVVVYLCTILAMTPLKAQEIDCLSLIERIEKTHVHMGNNLNGNAFSDSLGSTLVSSGVWLAAVQAIRGGQLNLQSFYDPAFLVTVPIDLALTLTSHWISLGKLPWLKKATDGNLFGKKFEYITRTSSNVLVSTGVINASWLIGGIPLTMASFTNSFVLCLLVYSTLQVTKPFLFKTLPKIKGANDLKRLSTVIPNLSKQVEDYLLNSEFDEKSLKQFKELFTYTLRKDLLSTSWETRQFKKSIAEDEKFYLIKQDIESLKRRSKFENDPNKLLVIQQRLHTKRGQLLKRLIKLSDNGESLGKAIVFDKGLDLQENIELIRFLNKIDNENAALLYGASFIDQALAVGLAGGVLLYTVNKWALEAKNEAKESNN